MRSLRTRALPPLVALALGACVTDTVTTRTWGDPNAGGPVRTGRVVAIRETVAQQQGDPGAGAVAGALVGGLLGNVLGGGYDAYGYYHGSGMGTLFGAVGGAMVGAAASQGGPPVRTYDLLVAFDDGGRQTFTYQGYPPFRVGQPVVLGPGGLSPIRRAPPAYGPPGAPPPYGPPGAYPPPPGPPPAGAVQQPVLPGP